MTSINELKEILKDYFTNTPLDTENEVKRLLETLESNKTLGDLFLSLLKVVGSNTDIIKPKVKARLVEFEPILRLIKKINRPGANPESNENIQTEYDSAVEFFNNLKQTA